MRLYRKIVVSTIAFALAGQFTALAAQGTDDGVASSAESQRAMARAAPLVGMEVGTIDAQLIAEAMPMVDRAPGGLFITAPFIDTLLVMNVRVYDSDGNKVMNARSFGEPLELMAVDLPNGQYRYEAVTVFMLDNPIGHGADYVDEGISRSFGSFYVTGDTLYENQRQVPREEASVLEQVIKSASYLAGVTLDVLIPSANAADLTASSADPKVIYDDTGTAGVSEWITEGNGGFGDYRVLDLLGDNVHAVTTILGTSGSTLNQNSLVVDSDGDIHWSESRMNFDRGQSALSIGWTSAPADISISSNVPDIRLHDETDTSEAEFQLENGVIQIWGRATDVSSWQDIFDISVLAPDDTLKIDESGLITLGGTTNTESSVLTLGNSGSARSQMTFSSDDGTAHIEWGQAPDLLQFENGAGQHIVEFNLSAGTGSLILDGSGNLGIGTFSPVENLHVVGNIRTDDYFRGQSINPGFWIDETGAGNKGANLVLDGGVLQIQRRAQGFGAYEAAPMRVFLAAPMNSLVVNASGYIGLGVNPTSPIHSVTGAKLSAGGVWQNASSRDLKENIRNLDAAEAMMAFKALNPVTYNYKIDSEDAYIGFIAEEVPEIVASKDRTTLGSMDMVALVTRVVQEQQDKIEEKGIKIKSLEQQLVQQHKRLDKLETMIRLLAGFEDSGIEVAANVE